MKYKSLLSYTLIATLLSFSSAANAAFDFGSPFDMWDDDDDYRYYDRGGRGYGSERWRRYDEWEPNYWRYRYFDDDSSDYFFDDFDNDFFGDGRGRFNFDMNMDMDSGYDGDYRNDYRYDRRDRGYRNDRGYRDDYDRPSRRSDRYNRGSRNRYENDRYNDDYWRNYSQGLSGGNRRMSDTPERESQRNERRANQPAECR